VVGERLCLTKLGLFQGWGQQPNQGDVKLPAIAQLQQKGKAKAGPQTAKKLRVEENFNRKNP